MSPFPVEALDEVIWRIDEAIGGPASKGFTTRGWIKKATGAEVVKFLSGLKDRLAHARYTLVDESHQSWLKEDHEPVQVVLRPAQRVPEPKPAPAAKTRVRKVLMVDDFPGMRGYIEKHVPDVEVTYCARLPDDESVLAQYDALVIDGDGIGNKKWKHGLDFCKAYDKPEGQAVVFYSGLSAHGTDALELERRGIANLPKGCNPEKLGLCIRFPMAKQTGGTT